MSLTFNEILSEAENLPLVSLKETTIYQENIPILKKFVDNTLTDNPSIHKLIGNNPLQVMYDNHTHHAAFMATIFSIGNYELLARTIPWVYRAYASHGFSYDYFPLELNTWLISLEKMSEKNTMAEIKSIYSWMIERHDDMVHISETEKELKLPIAENWLERKNSFLAALLEGDHRKCLTIAKEYISTGDQVEQFHLQIVQPALYEIGMLWEGGSISVAQEHLASAIVSRVMATTSMIDIPQSQSSGKAVITAAANEFHETGAWMISDTLERLGWKVRYLGANTPISDLLELLRDFQPELLAVSVTMPFNILKAKDLITAVRKDDQLKNIFVVTGGRAFNEIADLWRSTGADSFLANIEEMKTFAQKWETDGRLN